MASEVMAAVVPTEMVAVVMAVPAVITPATTVTVSIRRVISRHINVGRRRIVIVFAPAMTSAAAVAMPVPTLVRKLDQACRT